MFLIDQLLLAPAKAVFFVFREIAKRADEESGDDEAVTQELRELYMLLESGKISEQEFERREQVLIRRLEKIENMRARG